MRPGVSAAAPLGPYSEVFGGFADAVTAHRCNAATGTIALRVAGSGRTIASTARTVSVMIELPGEGQLQRRTPGGWVTDACTLGRLFLDLPGDEFEVRLDGACRLLHLWFEPEVFATLSAAGDERPIAIDALRALDGQPLPTLIPVLCRTLLGGKVDRALAIRALVACSRQASVAQRGPGLTPAVLRRVIAATDHPNRVRSLAELAAIAELSAFHFSRQFRHETNQSPYSFLLRRRVQHAMRHLSRPDEPVDRIAQDMGFTHSSHMGRAFNKAFGMSPAAARRHLLP